MLAFGLFIGGFAMVDYKLTLKDAFCPYCNQECEVHKPSGRFKKAKRGKPCVCTGCERIYKYNGNKNVLTT